MPISASSQPAIMGVMLELLGVRPGDRVLEIGTGSGYNAALLAVLVGPRGRVTTIDLDEDLVDAARARLDAHGFGAVRTRRGDGTLGAADDGPFEAIVATVAVGGVPAAWHAQLREGGRLVMPLALGLSQKVVAFERKRAALVSTAIVDASFITLRGPLAGLAPVVLGDPPRSRPGTAPIAPAQRLCVEATGGDGEQLALSLRWRCRRARARRPLRFADEVRGALVDGRGGRTKVCRSARSVR